MANVADLWRVALPWWAQALLWVQAPREAYWWRAPLPQQAQARRWVQAPQKVIWFVVSGASLAPERRTNLDG